MHGSRQQGQPACGRRGHGVGTERLERQHPAEHKLVQLRQQRTEGGHQPHAGGEAPQGV